MKLRSPLNEISKKIAQAQTTRVLVASNGHYKVHDPVEYKMWKRRGEGGVSGT